MTSIFVSSPQKNELQDALLERKRLNRELLGHILKASQYEKVRDGHHHTPAELIRSMAAYYAALQGTRAWGAVLCIPSTVLILNRSCRVNISALFVLTKFGSVNVDRLLPVCIYYRLKLASMSFQPQMERTFVWSLTIWCIFHTKQKSIG